MAMKREFIRIDFATTVVSADEETRVVRFMSHPDPRRYEMSEVDGKVQWRDKFLGYVFGSEILHDMAAQAPGLPLSHTSARIEKAEDYAAERHQALVGEHSGHGYMPPKSSPAKGSPLAAATADRPLTFVSVDIVGSTALRAHHGERYDEARRVFLRELALTFGQFNGTILKMTGDGFIGYFDQHSINAQADACPDCCLSLLSVLQNAVNLAGAMHDIPELKIRIGADHGPASVGSISVPEIGFTETDIVSDAINRAVKLQEAAPTNGILIGRELYTKLHVNWLLRCEAQDKLSGFMPEPYQVYRVE